MMRLIFMSCLIAFCHLGEAVEFTLATPKGWECIKDKKQLPAKVEVVYIGSSKAQFAPSINVTMEETEMEIDEYMKLVQKYHSSIAGTRCHAVGALESPEGKLRVLQIDRSSQWGVVRFLQAIKIKDQIAYVITATCLNSEFSIYYPEFMRAMQSFKIEKSS